jgi:sugar phosphate isomerase/epimerase
MGTPEYSLFEAIDLFSKIGLEGIEIIIQTDGYKSALPFNAPEGEIRDLIKKLEDSRLPVSGLTPYLNLYNDIDEGIRQKECDDLKRVIDMAVKLGAGFIRIYGGKLVEGEDDREGKKLAQLVKSMTWCGDYAKQGGIKLCLENHFGTMTTGAAETIRIIRAIDHPNVGILYDQANIAFFPAEEYEAAIELQRGKIFYVHCKDLVYRNGVPEKPKFNMVSHVDPEDRTVRSRIPGEGILDWKGILKKLNASGYDGWISLEYERRWIQTDLPEASIGMPAAARYIRSIIGEL